ncbi:NDP-hexose 2,3-dehydratase family protein [Actinocorallia aurea]
MSRGVPLAERLAVSAAPVASESAAECHRWLRERADAHRFAIEPIPFGALRGWRFADGTGNLVHDSGRFFTVEGLRIGGPDGPVHQPVIDQPEIGILGILAKEFDGVLHFLMQAKMEPGNPCPVMLSPTVQATRSNYTRVHRGSPVRHLEHFLGPGRGRVVADVLQSEHGDWFRGKRNRNMVVEALGPVEEHEDFRWVTLAQLHALLGRDNVVNMDARTVLSCLPRAESAAEGRDVPVTPTQELLSWFTDRRADAGPPAVRLPLAGLPGWRYGPTAISREDGAGFRVVAVDVRAEAREVASWSQPLIEPVGRGLAAFLVREFGGVTHVLVQALPEPGFRDGVELGPTVQRMSRAVPAYGSQAFLDHVPPPGSPLIRFEAVHAEEGGRFLRAESRYVIADAGPGVPDAPPPGFAWATAAQLTELLRHCHYVNVQARTLMVCLNALG